MGVSLQQGLHRPDEPVQRVGRLREEQARRARAPGPRAPRARPRRARGGVERRWGVRDQGADGGVGLPRRPPAAPRWARPGAGRHGWRGPAARPHTGVSSGPFRTACENLPPRNSIAASPDVSTLRRYGCSIAVRPAAARSAAWASAEAGSGQRAVSRDLADTVGLNDPLLGRGQLVRRGRAPQRGHDRQAGGLEVAQVGLVGVPPQDLDGIAQPRDGARPAQELVPPPGVVPAGPHHAGAVGGPVHGRVVPADEVDPVPRPRAPAWRAAGRGRRGGSARC
jgi:hypothetical protein